VTRSDFLAEIAGIRDALDTAAQTLLSLSERGLELSQTHPLDAEVIEAAFLEILQACAFQDLVGQRLDRLAASAAGRIETRAGAHLLNGPAAQGLDQAAADRLMQVE
jgi:chemotaxis regulatin CheY-phosphate phosphatase CheZ